MEHAEGNQSRLERNQSRTTDPSSGTTRPAASDYPPHGEQVYAARRHQVEETIAQIWQQVLGVEQVGADDNLFDLGADSLSMLQIVAKLREVFGVEIPIRTLFDSTQSELVETIEAANGELTDVDKF